MQTCSFNVGAPALGLTGVSLQQYEVTFSQYLNSVLSDELGCTFDIVPLYSATQLFNGLAQGQIDFGFVEASTYPCLYVS